MSSNKNNNSNEKSEEINDEITGKNNLEQNGDPENNHSGEKKLQHVRYLSGMYKHWFLDYASYVILERAVPYIEDGLKPVQRRILHAMKRLDDGRYNKVANIIGFTMQYHPHGDASIGDALVSLGQKDLLIDTQGNWGNIYTGDAAAASRYIEARLSKFALEVVFNAKTTRWKLSYDGRNKEPVTLPVKFPLVLAQGVEGIAVGLASKILPHNFIELVDAAIAHLRGKEFEILPDFATCGLADFSKYNDGLQGGKVRVRARIEKADAKTLVIKEIPFGKTTTSLIESILAANEKGKIKIKKIDDNTAENVEIQVHLTPGTSPDKMIDALYAFTDCEISISPNSCVIINHKPIFIGVSDILKISAENTRDLLKLELEIRLGELEDLWHLSSLEKIFIENRIYNDIEECETWESIIETIDRGLEPFKNLLKRDVTYDDIVRLTEIKIKRISKYDSFKADEYIKSLEDEMEEVKFNLANLILYTIDYYERIKEKYGKGKGRKTEIRGFHIVEATKVVAANQKLYMNAKEGFIGTSLKKDEFINECSDIDDVIVFLKNGKYVVAKVSEKSFVGKDIIYAAIFKKNDDRTVYNVIYQDGKDGNIMVKRFSVPAVTRDRDYDVSKGADGSRILYFTANPNGEAETVKVYLKPKKRVRNLKFEFDFGELAIKGRNSIGNIMSRHAVDRIVLKEKGVSTLGGIDIWFDPAVMRINSEKRGSYLGNFSGDDKISTITRSGHFDLHTFDITTHFDDDTIIVEKFNPEKIFSAVFYDGEQQYYYLKRFEIEETAKRTSFINGNDASKLIAISGKKSPRFEIKFGGRHANRPGEIIDANDFIAVKGHKARGKRLTTFTLESITEIDPLIPEEENGAQEETQETGDDPQRELNFPDDN
jgi:topoisomerase-4 subunit A